MTNFSRANPPSVADYNVLAAKTDRLQTLVAHLLRREAVRRQAEARAQDDRERFLAAIEDEQTSLALLDEVDD